MFGVVLVAAAALLVACGSHPKAPGSCNSDKDCKAPLVCSANKCVECTSDAQCGSGQKCSANACVAGGCTSDDQCPSGQVCQAGECKPCASNDECGPGGSCVAGACQRGKKCSQDADCADDEDCKGGYCVKAVQTTSAADAPCTLETVYFAFDQAGIQQAERDHLDQNQQCIEKAKGKSVFVIGHTDSTGTEEYNIALSERRAQAVADYLARLGTDPARLQVIPKGETEPTGLGDEKDRRVEFQWH